MKILLLSHIFPPAIDGGSRVVYKLGKYFESQHHQTIYLSSNCSSTDDFVRSKYLKSKKITSNQIKLPVYHHLRRLFKFLNLFFKKDILNIFQKGPVFKVIPFTKATIRIIKFKPDLIIAGPLPTTILLYARFFKFISNTLTRQNIPLLINSSFHPTDLNFHQLPLIKSLKKADYLWTLTQFETNYFIKNFNIDSKKIILAGNGVDSDFLKTKKEKIKSSKDLNILFVGSLAAHKGIILLIKSFLELIKLSHFNNLNLTIAGQKTLFYPQIEKLINSLNLKTRLKIKFKFNFAQKELSRLIDNSSVLILPSTQESFGLVIIESWARQKPVICSNLPTLKELVEKSKGGLIFKINNKKDLIKKIKFILDNPEKAEQMGKNGYEYVKNNYTWNKVGEKICQKILF